MMYKIRNSCISVLVLSLITNCYWQSDIPSIVEWKMHYGEKVVKHKKLNLEFKENDSTMTFLYQDDFSEDKEFYSKIVLFKNKSSIVVDLGHKCSKVDEIEFEFNEKQYVIGKYYFDIEDVEDVEKFYYVSDDFGMLVNLDASPKPFYYSTYTSNEISRSIINKILKIEGIK